MAASIAEMKAAYFFTCTVLLLCSIATGSCPPGMSAENMTAGGNRSLEDVLKAMNGTSSSDKCFAVHLLPVTHVLSEILKTWDNVVLMSQPGSESEGRPIVSCSIAPPEVPLSSASTQDLAALTFRGSRYAGIDGVVFENCPLAIQFLEVEEVSISNSIFRNFSVGGAVNVYNCSQVAVTSCEFTDNTAQGIFTDLPYRGNGGGLSIGIHNVLGNRHHNYSICDCKFTNNAAWSNGTRARSSTNIIEDRIFNGRGGGVAVVLSQASPVTVLVQGCNFTNNTAFSFAGGLYFLPANPSRGHMYFIEHSLFEDNVALTGGGGLGMGYISNGAPGATNWCFIRNCIVRDNWSTFGGGLYIIPGSLGGAHNRFFMEDCELTGNQAAMYGAAVALSALRSYLDRDRVGEVYFRDNMFDGNTASSGGVLSSYYFSVRFEGRNTFTRNFGTSMRVVSSLVHVNGTLAFMDNDNMVGSSLYVSSFGQLLLYRDSQLLFEGNRGSIAAAIEVEPLFVEPFLIQVLYNPQCFLLYEDTALPPSQWKVNVSFVNNGADIGAAIYTSQLGLCSFASPTDPIFRLDRTFLDGPFSYRNNTNRALKEKEEKFSIATYAENFSVSVYPQTTINAFPGEELEVMVCAWDELGHPTAGLFRITERQGDDEYSLRFVPSSVLVLPNQPNRMVHFGSTSNEFDDDEHVVGFQLETPNRFSQVPKQTILMMPSPCPAGHVLEPSAEGLFLCRCNSANRDILDCTGSDVMLRDGTWGVSYLLSAELRLKLEVTVCPPGYCQCHTFTEGSRQVCRNVYRQQDADYQCRCNRKGPLCGACSNGTAVSALLDNCVHCTAANATLIVSLILIDIAVLVTIMLLSLWKTTHLPAWTYPFLFYIQLAPYATRNFPLTFDLFHSYLFYLGSLLGLYFPYDFCLYPNATAVEVYGIKYIPFILASVICPSVIVAANCRGIKVNYSGVWLIVMLLFNQVVYTSASVLNCPRLADENGTISSVWFVDGTVKCFTGGHIPLALWAILCLLLCVVAIFIPIVLICCPKEAQPRVLRSAGEAVTHVYRERYRGWYFVELLRRFLLIIIVVSTPNTPTARSATLMVCFGLLAYCKPYKQKWVNYLEMCLLAHFFTTMLIKATLVSGFDDVVHSYQFLPEMDECGYAALSASSLAVILAVWYYCPLLLLLAVPAAFIVRASRRAKWSQREKEKLQAQQAELKKISNEEHITHTSLNLDENDIAPRAPSVHYPQERGPAKTFSEFIRSIKRRATRRHDTEEKTPQQQKSSTLPAGVIASSQA